MSNREKVITSVETRLGTEGIHFNRRDSELVEQTTFGGSIATKAGDRSVSVTVTRYPRGENPETYGGSEVWTVDLLDAESGEPLERPQNPVESLADALSVIDWNRVRRALSIDE